MGQPEKKRGFRKITIDGRTFKWRFDSLIDIRPAANKENKLKVDFGWFDEFLYISDRENRPPDFEPKIVTPEFVKQAIKFALNNDWHIEPKTGMFELSYRDGRFNVNALRHKL
jgi:hypothetical protein